MKGKEGGKGGWQKEGEKTIKGEHPKRGRGVGNGCLEEIYI